MSYIAKLNLKTVHRNAQKDPVIARREKLAAAIEEQRLALMAALVGESYSVKVKRWQTNDVGERVEVERDKQVRRWFFEQDGGYYVQCRYGSRTSDCAKCSPCVLQRRARQFLRRCLLALLPGCLPGKN